MLIHPIESSISIQNKHEPEVNESLGIRCQSVRIGSITLEFCEALAQNSLCADAFRTRGDGVFNLRFEVSSLETEKQRLKERDVKLYSNLEAESSACFDTRAEGNMLLRLIQARF
jgi:hypothetical protein